MTFRDYVLHRSHSFTEAMHTMREAVRPMPDELTTFAEVQAWLRTRDERQAIAALPHVFRQYRDARRKLPR